MSARGRRSGRPTGSRGDAGRGETLARPGRHSRRHRPGGTFRVSATRPPGGRRPRARARRRLRGDGAVRRQLRPTRNAGLPQRGARPAARRPEAARGVAEREGRGDKCAREATEMRLHLSSAFGGTEAEPEKLNLRQPQPRKPRRAPVPIDRKATLRQAWPREEPGAARCVRSVDDQCVLQFTLVLAASCVLHRRTSRVIHR